MTTALVDNPTTTEVEPATVTWVGTSGDWYDSANWSTGQVPTVNDIVTIRNMARGTTYDISFSDRNPVYGGLNLLDFLQKSKTFKYNKRKLQFK